jgi:tetratricopeptide (TPR) repeat protein
LDRKAILERALADFDEGVSLSESAPDQAAEKVRAALGGFESVVRSGVISGPLYYNIGNAYLRLGRLGMAIANYRRAEKLIPGDGNLEANLSFARNQRRNQIAESGSRTVLHTLFFWHYRLPLRTRYLLAMGLYVACWVVLIARPYVRQVGLRLAAALLAVGWVTFGVSIAVERGVQSRVAEGVLVADEVVVRKGNGENYDPEFKQLFYDGVEFTVRERRGPWLKIELPDGGGWIRADQAELI